MPAGPATENEACCALLRVVERLQETAELGAPPDEPSCAVGRWDDPTLLRREVVEARLLQQDLFFQAA